MAEKDRRVKKPRGSTSETRLPKNIYVVGQTDTLLTQLVEKYPAIKPYEIARIGFNLGLGILLKHGFDKANLFLTASKSEIKIQTSHQPKVEPDKGDQS
ncbi:MAG: hypothetical protein V4507_10875 [Verrucomicrobiota bacterium]